MTSLKSWVISHAGSRYIAGETLDEIAPVCQGLTDAGYGLTLCYWDGAPDTPGEVALRYGEALEVVDGFGGYLSVKAPSLDFSYQLFETLADRGPRLHFDAMESDTVERTFALLERLPGELGCTLPGRWSRSDADAERVIDLGLSVRVVKGQFRSEDDRNPEEGFLAVIDRLAGRARHVGVASHDRLLAAEALRRLRAAGTSCELEQLFGVPREAAPARVYLPYGHALLPYAMAQVKDNPRILWWLARDLALRRTPGL